ncbi:MAG: DNA sulfur modification protein DndD [Mycobacterium sp.]|nr:DNA sulfur modification protein DndD [Mycobacterium sp.]
MILDQLVLTNVGVFAGRHEIRLTPPSAKKPVTLIGGLNGSGKTTILEAILFALYGPLARTVSGRAGSYEAYLRQLIHSSAAPGDSATVDLGFHAYREGTRYDYEVSRYWRITERTTPDSLSVSVNGRHDKALTERWAEHVEAFMPRGIAELFFFDGEKVETLAELDNARAMLRTVIGALLGLDLVDRLDTDLNVLERRHRQEKAPEDLQGTIDAQQTRVRELRSAEERATQQRASVRNQLERAAKLLHEREERYRLEGGELFEQQKQLQDRRKYLKDTQLADIDARLRDIARDAGPFLLVKPLLAAVVEHGETELAAAKDQRLADMLTERDAAIMVELRRLRPRSSVVEAIERYLTDDRAQRLARTTIEPIVGLNEEGVSQARDLMSHRLPDVAADIARLVEHRSQTLAELEDVERHLAAVPSNETINELQSARDEALAAHSRAQHELERLEAMLAEARTAREAANREYEKLLSKAANATLEAEDVHRLLGHTQRARATLARFRGEAVRRHLARIEQHVLRAIHQLFRKSDLIGALSIDPKTFGVELQRGDGTPLTTRQLSAGERQLLAVALLWGLAQASGRALPIVIDTPLGRLDGQHRTHLVERYFPHASHQVILLSTDQEIDQTAWERLKPAIGHSYYLDHPAHAGATTVENGYFW